MRALGVLLMIAGAAQPALEVVAPERAPMPPGLARLVAAYPEFLVPTPRPNVAAWKDGAEMVYDDGAPAKDFETLLNAPCLKDQMAMAYPRGWPAAAPGLGEDPGRVRYEPLFRKMYGSTRAEVEARLVPVRWAPAGNRSLRFSRVNGAAAALERVGLELARARPGLRSYAARPLGAYHWRVIKNTGRLSPHSFGIAIDFELPRRLVRYWEWDARGGGEAPAYPAEVLQDDTLGALVTVFENHGFIWGGKWRHYDTMHFEYRPELLDSSPEPAEPAHSTKTSP